MLALRHQAKLRLVKGNIVDQPAECIIARAAQHTLARSLLTIEQAICHSVLQLAYVGGTAAAGLANTIYQSFMSLAATLNHTQNVIT